MRIDKRNSDMKREKGFTLVEVMVALCILAFGILAIASMQTAALSGTTKANHLTQATNVAMTKMEEIWPMGFNQTITQNGATDTIGIYNTTIAVTTQVGSPNIRVVTVTVTWQEKGINKTTQLTFIKNKL